MTAKIIDITPRVDASTDGQGLDDYFDTMMADTDDPDISAEAITDTCALRLWSAKHDFDNAMRDGKIDEDRMSDVVRSFAQLERLLVEGGYAIQLAVARETVRRVAHKSTRPRRPKAG